MKKIRILKINFLSKISISGIILVLILILVIDPMNSKYTIESLDRNIRITDIIALSFL